MLDSRDFLMLCRLAVPGAALIVLGVGSTITSRTAWRCAVSFCVALLGVLLVVEGGAALHRRNVPVGLTGLILLCGGAGLLAACSHRLLQRWLTAVRTAADPAAALNSPADGSVVPGKLRTVEQRPEDVLDERLP